MTTKSSFEKFEKQFGTLTFGKMLRAWRQADNYTQTDFAKKLGISLQNLNDLEKERKIPSATRAAKIAKKLKLPEMGLIQLALRDALKKEGFPYKLSLQSA